MKLCGVTASASRHIQNDGQTWCLYHSDRGAGATPTAGVCLTMGRSNFRMTCCADAASSSTLMRSATSSPLTPLSGSYDYHSVRDSTHSRLCRLQDYRNDTAHVDVQNMQNYIRLEQAARML